MHNHSTITKIIIILYIVCIAGIKTSAQYEYLSNVNPLTGNTEKKAHIVGVTYIYLPHYTTVNETLHLYTVVATDSVFKNVTIYSVNELTGDVVYKAPYTQNLSWLQYGAASILYGCANTNVIVKVDPASGAITPFVTLPDCQNLIGATFDKRHNRLFTWGTTNTGAFALYAVNTLSGATIEKPTVHLDELEYDEKLDSIYGLSIDNGIIKIISADTSGVIATTIKQFPANSGIYPGQGSMNTNHHVYYVAIDDGSGHGELYQENVQTHQENVLPAHITSNFYTPNTILYRWDNALDSLYALNWDPSYFPFSLGNDTTLCSGQSLTYKDSVPGATFLWSDGTTAARFIISKPGTYWVSVSKGYYKVSDTIRVVYYSKPGASFTDSVNNFTCHFFNHAVNADKYKWNFGDGSFDASVSPVHTYLDTGIYHVTLVASNKCFSDTFTNAVQIKKPFISTDTCGKSLSAVIKPNPLHDSLLLYFSSTTSPVVYVRILTVTGQIAAVIKLSGIVCGAQTNIDVRQLAAAPYFLQLIAGNMKTTLKFIEY